MPAFAGLGAPHWDRQARAALTGMSNSTTRAHIARAAVDAVAQQICDIAETIPATDGTPRRLRADGGATVSDLLMQTQADLLGHPVEVADVPEISALGAAELAWTTLGQSTTWSSTRTYRVFEPTLATPSPHHFPRPVGRRRGLGPHLSGASVAFPETNRHLATVSFRKAQDGPLAPATDRTWCPTHPSSHLPPFLLPRHRRFRSRSNSL